MASTSPSSIARLLYALIYVGFGVGLGFALFYFQFHAECSKRLLEAELKHNSSLTSLLAEQQQQIISTCPAAEPSESSAARLSQVQTLLESQTALAGKHQALLEQHEAAIHRLSQLQSALDSSTQTVSSHSEQIKRLQRELGQSTVAKVQAEKQVEGMKDQLQLAQSMLKQKVLELEDFRSSTDIKHQSSSTSNEELLQLQATLRQWSLAQILNRFGEGPHTVEIELQMPEALLVSEEEEDDEKDDDDDDEEDYDKTIFSIQVEIQHIQDMPHTIFTFLSLVELDLYTGTTLSFESDNHDESRLLGGSPNRAGNKQMQSKLTRRFAEAGYSTRRVIWIPETSLRDPCRIYSLALPGPGPDVVITLSDQAVDGSMSCPGHIVRGKESLERLANIWLSGREEKLTIVSAKLLR